MNSGAPARSGLFTYENGVLLLLGLTFGFLFFDRNAAGNLVPFITNDLKLNNAQIGLVTSALSLTWAISAYAFGAWSDRIGVRKPFLLASVVSFFIYLRVIVAMYMQEPEGTEALSVSRPLRVVLVAAIAVTLVLGLFPIPLLRLTAISLPL